MRAPGVVVEDGESLDVVVVDVVVDVVVVVVVVDDAASLLLHFLHHFLFHFQFLVLKALFVQLLFFHIHLRRTNIVLL